MVLVATTSTERGVLWVLLARKLRANIPCAVQDTLDPDGGVHGTVENQVLAIGQDAQARGQVLARRKGQRIVEQSCDTARAALG